MDTHPNLEIHPLSYGSEIALPARDGRAALSIQCLTSPGLTDYQAALTHMEQTVEQIHTGNASNQLWFLEHPPVYTAGTSAKPDDLLSDALPVFQTGRGGQYTYHGPGMRIVYVMLDLKQFYAPKKPDIRHFVCMLERSIIAALKSFDISGTTHPDRIGIWVPSRTGRGGENKIAALGLRIRRGISYHGIAINLNPDLAHFKGIVPCGIKEFGVTSIHQEGHPHVTLAQLDQALLLGFRGELGRAVSA